MDRQGGGGQCLWRRTASNGGGEEEELNLRCVLQPGKSIQTDEGHSEHFPLLHHSDPNASSRPIHIIIIIILLLCTHTRKRCTDERTLSSLAVVIAE